MKIDQDDAITADSGEAIKQMCSQIEFMCKLIRSSITSRDDLTMLQHRVVDLSRTIEAEYRKRVLLRRGRVKMTGDLHPVPSAVAVFADDLTPIEDVPPDGPLAN